MSRTPIADYALISDCHSAALVSREGSIDWLCRPRFDSPSVFGRLLGDDAGHWSISPTASAETERRYLEHSMVLETTFRTPSGSAKLLDAMALDPSAEGHDLGRGAPRMVVRVVEGIDGDVEFDLSLAPRPEYGLIQPRFGRVEGGAAGRGGPIQTALSSEVPIEIDGATVRTRFRVGPGDRIGFAVQNRAAEEPPPKFASQDEILRRLDGTVESWRRWSSVHQAYEGPWSDLVYHSGRVLQALSYQPTGAMVAAPTTSLPEAVGGERNWDYRFAWVRDASFTLEALWVAACPDEADRFFAWMAGTVASQLGVGSDLQIMFGIGGEHDLTERTIPQLTGWRGSRPVRIGNGAWEQRQLDVYGELLGAAQRLVEQLGGIDDVTKGFLIEVADAAEARWRETDQGIWEIRGEPRAFVYSKLMCWVAMDRAIEMAELLGADPATVERWTGTRDEIREWILERGWSDSAKAFVQSEGSDELDASNLMMPIVGFLPADDPRVLATIRATEERLTDDRGLVYRYRAHDGLEGEEGTFLLCTFWLAHAQALAGQTDRARGTFERAVAYVNDVGLLAEEVDEASGELLGNYPQAFSHIGLINAAWAIAQADAGST
jgi:GH15 family glucan-1,4-alpha-glucosidase